MGKIKYVKYEEDLCFKCLNRGFPINTYELKNRGYGSIYDSYNTKLQLCNECVGSIDNHKKLERWFDEKPKMIGYEEEYEYETNIDAYIKTLPIQGRELFENQIEKEPFRIDSQEWIDNELRLISDDLEIEVNEEIKTADCTYENLKLNKDDVIVIRYPSDENGYCKINIEYMNLIKNQAKHCFEGYNVWMIPDVIKISTISKEKEDI